MQYLKEYEQLFPSLPKSQISCVGEIYAKRARGAGLAAGVFDKRYRELTGRKMGVERRALRRELPEKKASRADKCIAKICKKNNLVLMKAEPSCSTPDGEEPACNIKTEPALDPVAKYWGYIAGAKIAREIAEVLELEAEKYQRE